MYSYLKEAHVLHRRSEQNKWRKDWLTRYKKQKAIVKTASIYIEWLRDFNKTFKQKPYCKLVAE